MTPQDITYIVFLFALGACVGSFLNVVVYRVPRNESLVSPGSHCPRCNTPLAWYDNLPVIGWLKLRGKCRYCKLPISPRYPIVEAVCGALFVFYFVMFFVLQRGPSETRPLVFSDGSMYVGPVRALTIGSDWPIYALDMYLVASLLAASLIDAELFIIPVGIPWLAAIVGIIGHTLIDDRNVPGALVLLPEARALAAGGGIGFLISVALWWRGIFPQSFSQGEPMLEVDRATKPNDDAIPLPSDGIDYHGPEMTKKEIFVEIRKEILFLMPPMAFAIGFWVLTNRVPSIGNRWNAMTYNHFVGGFLGSVFGALIGGLVVWLTRILGTLGFGRVAMGLGDVHLMFGVGAIIGAGASTVAFFIAPFFGIIVAVYFLLTRSKRELPYGPYLSMAVGVVLLFYNPIAAYLTPGFEGLGMAIRSLIGSP